MTSKTRMEMWKEKQLQMQLESKSVSEYAEMLERENYTLIKQVDELLEKVHSLEVDKTIAELKLKYLNGEN